MNLQPLVGVVHVVFPLALHHDVPGVPAGRSHALRAAADREPLDERAVQPHIEVVRPTHPPDVIVVVGLQLDLDAVFAVNGEVMPDRDAAERPERQVLAQSIVLHEIQMDLVGIHLRTGGGDSDRQPADLSSCREVAVEQRRRHGQLLGVVVESLIVGVIAR